MHVLSDGIYCSNRFKMSQWYTCSFIDQRTQAIQLIVKHVVAPGRVLNLFEQNNDGSFF